jgi:hypothetical protein
MIVSSDSFFENRRRKILTSGRGEWQVICLRGAGAGKEKRSVSEVGRMLSGAHLLEIWEASLSILASSAVASLQSPQLIKG